MRNSKIRSVLRYSQNFSLFWPFLEKMADFSKPSKNRDTDIVRTYSRKFWVRKSKIRSVLTYSQNLGHFWRFLETRWFLNTKILPPVISKYLRNSPQNSSRHSFEVLKKSAGLQNRQKWPKFWEYVKTDLIFEFLTQNFLG